MNTRRKIFLILTILWMVVIFWFSARTGPASQSQSNRVGYLIGRIFLPGFEGRSPAEQLAFAESISFFVRKTGHALEYAILGFLLCFAADWKRSLCRIAGFSLIISALYACTDEFHQLFVPERAGRVADILIDCGGACLGILAALVLLWCIRGRVQN